MSNSLEHNFQIFLCYILLCTFAQYEFIVKLENKAGTICKQQPDNFLYYIKKNTHYLKDFGLSSF